jgi:hypothetical protein
MSVCCTDNACLTAQACETAQEKEREKERSTHDLQQGERVSCHIPPPRSDTSEYDVAVSPRCGSSGERRVGLGFV